MGIKKKPVSQRQKMINLMYVVLMAMLALNVSSEVLDSFGILDKGMRITATGNARENQLAYEQLERLMQENPKKAKTAYGKAQEVRRISDSLYVFAQTLKMAVAREADGPDGDPEKINNIDDLEAASQVMAAPGRGKAEELAAAVASYRKKMMDMMDDKTRQHVVRDVLISYEKDMERVFDGMPAVAAVTILSKLQSDVRHTEGEVLRTLLSNIGQKDMRVNSLQAFVIPESKTVIRGNSFTADIVMAAVDTTNRPAVFIEGYDGPVTDGHCEVPCLNTGTFALNGYMTLDGADCTVRRPFSQQYTVIEPTATVSADLTNVLYAGYDNPVSISVPGVTAAEVTAEVTAGTARQTAPGHYIIRPDKAGTNTVVTVYAAKQVMTRHSFRVRALPAPTPVINTMGETFRGGRIAKAKLIQAKGVDAAVDDGILHIPFRVKGFEMVAFDNMGNAVTMTSQGTDFSPQQKETIRMMPKGRRIYISHVRATGPDGSDRLLQTAVEIIIG